MELNVLISSAGRQGPLVEAFVHALSGQGKVFVADINPYASAKGLADHSINSLGYSDENYGDWCLNVCEKFHIGLWISLLEDELLVLEGLREAMSKLGCVLVGAPTDRIRSALDKYSHTSFLTQYGIKVPPSFTLKELESNRNIDEGAYIVKERRGRGSRGIVKVHDVKELFEVAKRKEYSEDWIAQRMVPGEVYCIDVINDLDRRFVASLIRKRLVMGLQETDVAETVQNDEIDGIAKKLSKAIGHQGCIDVDIIENEEGCFVIDINVRFGGSHIFSLMSGANIPSALVAWRLGKDVNPGWLKHRTGEILSRYSTVTKLSI